MWLATRHEGFDGPRGNNWRQKNGKGWTLMDIWSRGLLRTGLGLQVLSLLILIFSHYIFEGSGFFSWDLRYTSGDMRANTTYRFILMIGCAIYLLGSVYNLSFQASLADDAAWARGYRAGSKLLATATFFAVLSGIFTLAGALNFYLNYTESYWTHYREGNIDWIFGAGARVIHALGALFFGFSFFLLEVYHDAGTNDYHAIVNAALYVSAGLGEICVIFLLEPSFGILLGLFAYTSALLWAFAFEDEVAFSSPTFDECELCNELEREVDELARRNPLA